MQKESRVIQRVKGTKYLKGFEKPEEGIATGRGGVCVEVKLLTALFTL
jgi:hypothetical protein